MIRVLLTFSFPRFAVEGGFIGGIVKDVHELGATQVEHDLGVHGEEGTESEGTRIVVPKVTKALTQLDQHPVEPLEDIRSLIHLCLEDGNAGEQTGSSILIKGGNDVWIIGVSQETCLRGDLSGTVQQRAGSRP